MCFKGSDAVIKTIPVNQCSKPTGWLGRFTLWRMNASHSALTDWGLGHIAVRGNYTILDVGCGGGRTVSKLAAIATQGKVYGVDYSEEGVAATKRTNARGIDLGSVGYGSVLFLSCRSRTACSTSSPPWKLISGGLICPATCAKSSASPSPAARSSSLRKSIREPSPGFPSWPKSSPSEPAWCS